MRCICSGGRAHHGGGAGVDCRHELQDGGGGSGGGGAVPGHVSLFKSKSFVPVHPSTFSLVRVTLCDRYMDFAAALQTMQDTSVQLVAYVPQGDTPVKAVVNLPAALKRFREEKEVLAAARVSGLLAKAAQSPSLVGKSPRTPLGERNLNA